jgi:hypothetical protein
MRKFLYALFALAFTASGAFGQSTVSGGGGVPQGPWTSFTPSPSCSAGTPTFTATSKWQQIAPKTTVAEWDVTITAISTCDSASNSVSMNLPNTAASGAGAATYDFIGGAALTCWVPAGTAAISCRTINATAAPKLVTNSHFVISLVYENQ